MTNSREYKTHLSDIFTRASKTYDQVGPIFFTDLGKKLVDFGKISKGSAILDIACGKGAVLLPASAAVSSMGEAIGIDISEGMIAELNQIIRKREIANAKVFVMDAENLEFPDASFDYVLCGLGLFFFPDLKRALSEFNRVLKPGGFLIASTFKKQKTNEIAKKWKSLRESFEDRIEKLPDVDTTDLDSVREIRNEMTQAGFNIIEVKTRRKTVFYKDEHEWWQVVWSHGWRSYLERIPSEHLPEYKMRAFEILQKKRTEKGIAYQWDLFFTKAQKPIG